MLKKKGGLDWPIPKNDKDLSRFIGFCTYYRRFIEKFAHILIPLYKLLRKDCKYVWTPECQIAFDKLKNHMVTYPVLRNPNFQFMFVITCDASGFVLGVIL